MIIEIIGIFWNQIHDIPHCDQTLNIFDSIEMCEAPCNWTHYEVYTQSVNSLRAHVLFVLTWDARAIQCIEQNKHDLARFRIVLRAQQIMMHWKLYGSLGGLASTFRLKNAQKFYLFFANYSFFSDVKSLKSIMQWICITRTHTP